MKKINLYITALLATLFISCEEVIDVDLDTQEPKLVIEANLIKPEEESSLQVIRLTKTRGYFDSQIPTVSNAEIRVKNLDTNVDYEFTELTDAQGVYSSDEISIAPGETFQLHISVDNEVYQATETVLETPNIDIFQQLPFENPLVEDAIEIKAHFKADENVRSFYLVQWFLNKKRFSFYVTNNQFYDENMTVSRFFQAGTEDDEYQIGDKVTVILTRISSTMYDYISKLSEVSGNAGNPFASPMGPVRGNIVNTTNPENYPLGYFSIFHTKTAELIIESKN